MLIYYERVTINAIVMHPLFTFICVTILLGTVTSR